LASWNLRNFVGNDAMQQSAQLGVAIVCWLGLVPLVASKFPSAPDTGLNRTICFRTPVVYLSKKKNCIRISFWMTFLRVLTVVCVRVSQGDRNVAVEL
jgi:hypothetical protein